jgi:hypothetical protein
VLRVQEQREDRNSAPAGGRSNGASLGDAGSISGHVAEIAAEIARLVRIRAARARLRANQTAFLVLGGVALAFAAAAAALAGVRLIESGLTAGLGELVHGRTWLAELWSGLVILAGTGIALVWLRGWSDRRILRHLRRRRERRG